MAECAHQWTITNIQFGFTVFERCSHCRVVQSYFSREDTWDEYLEKEHHWSIVENAQSFRFDLRCARCEGYVAFEELLGLMYCTSCMEDCEVEILQKKCESEKIFLLVGFGALPVSMSKPIPDAKLQILADYFNQRRDTNRSTVKIVPNSLIKDISLCRGAFIHDVGMLSLEEPGERKPLF